ncbi:RIP metalloprotease [bacterium]|nr:RIP metalloprotease [bacterium]
MMGYLATFLAFNLIVFVHEMGHLLVARWGGMAVSEFSIGMGPRLIHVTWRHIRYSWRLFPIGGSVHIVGMDDDEDIDGPVNGTAYRDTPLGRRLAAILAGSVANLLLGFLIFLGLFAWVGQLVPSPVIQSVTPDMPAMNRLQRGDLIVALNQRPVTDVARDVMRPLQSWGARPLTVTVRRNGVLVPVSLTPVQKGDRVMMGVTFGWQKTKTPASPSQIVTGAARATWQTAGRTLQSIQWLVTGKVKWSEMTGVVGMVQVGSYGYQQGIVPFLTLLCVISIGLGVFNLLPIPVLDGGHVVMIVLEAVRGKPLSPVLEKKMGTVFFAILMGLMVLFFVSDIQLWNQRHRQFSTQVTPP